MFLVAIGPFVLADNAAIAVESSRPGNAVGAAPGMNVVAAGPCEPEWSGFGTGVTDDGTVTALLAVEDGPDGPALYAAGQFEEIGGVGVGHVARWDGTRWWAVGRGFEYERDNPLYVNDLEPYRGEIYAGGGFNRADGELVEGIARWDGERWRQLGDVGLDGTVDALLVFEGELFVAGRFDTAGGLPAGNVAAWDGQRWRAVGLGMDDDVRALVVFDDGGGPALYAAGDFVEADAAPASGLARWDGTRWSAVGGNALAGGVHALAASGDALYAAGHDFTIDGEPVESDLLTWNGERWSSLAHGVAGGSVGVLEVIDGVLFAGGNFDRAGGAETPLVARWNGSFWSPVDTRLPTRDWLGVIEPWRAPDGTTSIVVAGHFDDFTPVPSRNIVAWRGCPIERPPAYGSCAYRVEEIDVERLSVRAIDNRGHVAGWQGTVARNREFAGRWSSKEGFVRLAVSYDYDESRAGDLNERGEVVGSVRADNSLQLAFLEDADGFVMIDPPGDGNWSSASAINGHGLVAGNWGNSLHGPSHGFLWQDGELLDIGPFVGTSSSRLTDVNDRGQAVGYRPFGSDRRPMLYDDGQVIDLGLPEGWLWALAKSVNERTQIVGWGRLAAEPRPIRAFLWEAGELTVLDSIGDDDDDVFAFDINDAGQIVGEVGGNRAFIVEDGVMRDLTRMIRWDGPRAAASLRAINDGGVILSDYRDGALLVPVPRRIGDITGDCRVDRWDLAVLLFEWDRTDSQADLDGDGIVGFRDLALLLDDWGPCQ